jgi:putative DNA primase/helicase
MNREFPPPDARLADKLRIERVGAPWKTQNRLPEVHSTLISRCAADIVPKRIDFLWSGRIARGKHTAIAGEPGDGKSQLSVYVAATVSRTNGAAP